MDLREQDGGPLPARGLSSLIKAYVVRITDKR